MTTQTLQGIIGTEPLHWRGDRMTLAEFNSAFVNLMGAERQLDDQQMQELTAFIASLKFPPNPYRNFDGSLPAALPGSGSPSAGQTRYVSAAFDGGILTCVQCHALPTGAHRTIISADLLLEPQSMKVPQLRNMHEKTGFSMTSQLNNRGFGYAHDGAFDTLMNFLRAPVFRFASGAAGEQQRRDLEAFMLCLATDTHAAVGQQETIASPAPPAAALARINQMVTLANAGTVGLVVHGRAAAELRGWRYDGGGLFQSDRATQTILAADLLAGAAPGSERTYTVVPAGSQTRIAIDRDLDGHFNRDELDAGSDPADPASVPGGVTPRPGDLNCDDLVNFDDIEPFVLALSGPAGYEASFPQCRWLNGDTDADGDVDFDDIDPFVLLLAGS